MSDKETVELNKQTIDGQTYEEIVKPLPVTIVRPTFTGPEAWGYLFSVAVNFFAGAWILMLILGELHNHLDPRIPATGYWTTMLVVIAADILFSGNSMFRAWTRPARTGEK